MQELYLHMNEINEKYKQTVWVHNTKMQFHRPFLPKNKATYQHINKLNETQLFLTIDRFTCFIFCVLKWWNRFLIDQLGFCKWCKTYDIHHLILFFSKWSANKWFDLLWSVNKFVCKIQALSQWILMVSHQYIIYRM